MPRDRSLYMVHQGVHLPVKKPGKECAVPPPTPSLQCRHIAPHRHSPNSAAKPVAAALCGRLERCLLIRCYEAGVIAPVVRISIVCLLQ